MSIALGAVVLFLAFTPGILLRRFYLSGDFSRSYHKTSPSDELIWAIISGMILQALGILIVEKVTNIRIDFQAVAYLLLGTKNDLASVQAFHSIRTNLGYILSYNVSLWIASAGLGITFRRIIRGIKLDRKCPFFRFKNDWHYVLTGEVLDFPRFSTKALAANEINAADISFAVVDVLVNVCDIAILYSGILYDYRLSPDGGLDTIHVKNAIRINLGEADERPSHDSLAGGDSTTDKYFTIPGALLSIPYKEIINLNIAYFGLEEIPQITQNREASEAE